MTFDDQSSQTSQTRFATRPIPPTPTNAHQSTTTPIKTDKLDSHTGSRFGLRSSSRNPNPNPTNPMDLFGPSGGGYSHHPPASHPQQTAYPPLTDASYGGGGGGGQPSTPGNPPTSSSSASSFAPAAAAAPPPTSRSTNARKSFAEQVRAFSHLDDVSTELSEMPKIKFKNRLFVLERWLNRPRARTSSIAEHGEFLMEVRAVRDGGAYEPVEPVWACTVGDCNHDLFSAKASSAALMHLEKRHGIVKTGGGRKRMAAAAAAAAGEEHEGGDGGGSGGVVEVLDTLASGGPPRKRMVLGLGGGGVPDKALGKLMKELAEERARNAALRQELDDQRRRFEDELRVQRDRHAEEMRLERERFSKNEDRLWRMIEKANDD